MSRPPPGKSPRPSPNRHGRLSNRDLLLRRLEQFSHSNSIADLDVCVEYLRRNYKNDYGRMKSRLFSKLVDEACHSLKLRQKQKQKRNESSDSDGDSHSDSDSDADSDGIDSCDDDMIETDSRFNLLNSSLCNTYSISCAADRDKRDMEDEEDQHNNIPAEEGENPKEKKPCISEVKTPPFASPSAIIAAASAARAADISVKKHKKHAGGGSSVKNHGKDSENGHASITADEDKGVAPVMALQSNANEKHGLRSKESSTSKVVDLHIKKDGKDEKTPMKKRPRQLEEQEKEITPSTAEAVRFSDLGGIDGIVESLREIMFPLYNPGIYSWLGLQPMRGILLHGPPGCGKTKLANAIAYEAGLPLLKISGSEIVSGMSGESEAKIRGLFAEAVRVAPSIVFIDEIDSITSKRENAQREMERRIVTQLMTCMDDLSQSFQRGIEENEDSLRNIEKSKHVLVIGATNRPEALDPALRRPGRFDREILLGVPNENGRAQILSVLAKHLRLEGSFDFKFIARCTPGFVGADLAALTQEAGSIAIKRIVSSRNPISCVSTLSISAASLINVNESSCSTVSEVDHCVDILETKSSGESDWWKIPWSQEEMRSLSITMQDFEAAVAVVQPSTKREGFSAIPTVKWEDVGALDSIQKMMDFFITRRIKHPEDYEVLGLDMDTGFLLYGPPGCGKTLVAKAVANDAQANFIYIKGPELLNKYVGESEQAVRVLFSRARSCAPCILFFDEMDALAPRRGTDGNAVAERVLNQLLSEMDGAEKRKGVFMMGATNRPDMIDPAVLRPGRLGKMLYIPLPDFGGRVSILKTLIRQKPISSDVDLALIASSKQCEGLSGADLAALVNEACVAALQEKCINADSVEPMSVCNRHFGTALSQISPSVSKQDLMYYESLPKKFNRTSTMMGIASGPCM